MTDRATTDELMVLQLFDQVRQQDWRDDALCAQVDADIMFPEKSGPGVMHDSAGRLVGVKAAREVCELCPVRAADLGGTGECLEFALENGERFGVWGGKSERERRLIIRDRQAEKRRQARRDQAQRRRRKAGAA